MSSPVTKREKKESDSHPLHKAREARKLWLKATSDDDLQQVKDLYIQWWDEQQTWTEAQIEKEIDPCELELQQEKCILLMCQLGLEEEAFRMMNGLGMLARLSREVLQYEDKCTEDTAIVAAEDKFKRVPDFPAFIADNLVPQEVLKLLHDAYLSPKASYWTSHEYSDEPPSPFFSYLIPLDRAVEEFGALGFLAHSVYTVACKAFPERATGAKYVEMWAHNRAHPTGHQMHFDSDDEGRNGIRNPTLGSVFYLSDNTCGGPTLITGQALGDEKLTPDGWFVFPRTNRLVIFDGKKLHGVVPGRGPKEDGGRRVTVMCAMWHDIEVRHSKQPGAARPFPGKGAKTAAPPKKVVPSAFGPAPTVKKDATKTEEVPEWAPQLTAPVPAEILKMDVEERLLTEMNPGKPQKLDVLWEEVDGKNTSWPCEKASIPPYEQVFQGF